MRDDNTVMRNLATIFTIPCAWALLIAVGYYAEEQTEWGRSGHPSSGILIVIFTMIAAPLFAAAGMYIAAHHRQTMSRLVYGASIFVNSCLAIFGVVFWIYMWLSG